MQAAGQGAALAGDKPIVSAVALTANTRAVHYVRSLMFVYSGSAAGVLGLTGLYGFGLYLFVYFVVSVALLVRMSVQGGSVDRYFLATAVPAFVWSGVAGQLVTYILFWTLTYALVHLY